MSVPAPPSGHAAGFHGSYEPSDIEFLLRPVAITPIGVEEKERLIQSGRRHYSEMLGAEGAPSPAYASLYRAALDAALAKRPFLATRQQELDL